MSILYFNFNFKIKYMYIIIYNASSVLRKNIINPDVNCSEMAGNNLQISANCFPPSPNN